MAKKEIPIRTFSKREKLDERAVEAMGSQDLPKWIMKKSTAEKKVREHLMVLQEIDEQVRVKGSVDGFTPVIIRADILPHAIAKSHRSEIGKLFGGSSTQSSVIGFAGENSILIKASSDKDLKAIGRRIQKWEENIYALSAIDRIGRFVPKITIPKETAPVLKIKLINFQDTASNSAVVDEFEKLCISLRPEIFKKTIYAENLSVYKIKATLDSVKSLKHFEGIFSIEPMPTYGVVLDSISDDFTVQLKTPKKGVDYPIVGILDSGIADIPHLKPWLMNKGYSCYPPDRLQKEHGTFVAGLVLYGDELLAKAESEFEGCRIFDATVFPDPTKEKIDQDDLIHNIQDAVKSSHKDVKIWNFSGGTEAEIDADKFSDFGIALDDIQRKYNVVICKSAGNCTNFLKGLPKKRISQSADSVKSIVVGSIAHLADATDLAKQNFPSPFSRVGRGPASIIKPDLAHYGGNAGVHNGKLLRNGVISFGLDGGFAKNIGTSFAVPRVTSALSSLRHSIGGEFNPLLLKCLLVHSASYPSAIDLSTVEKLRHMGFGVPSAAKDALFNDPYESTLVLQDTIEKGKFIEILDFPFPPDLEEDGFYYGEVIVTLAFDQMLDPTQGIEYCQSNMKIAFGTYDNKRARDIEKRHIRNPIGKSGAQNILLQTCYSKKSLGNHAVAFGGERLLTEYGDKFHPIKKYGCDLTEMTKAKRVQCLKAPKKWFLRIDGLFRSFCEKEAKRDGLVLQQNFCLCITIRDPKRRRRINESVVRALDSNGFSHSLVTINSETRVRVG